MTQRELQRDLRSAISITYDLLRHEHVLAREQIARALGELESELARIEAKLGGPRRGDIVAASLDPSMDRVERIAAEADPVVADQIRALVASLRDIQRKLAGTVHRASPAAVFIVAGGAVALGALASVVLARTRRSRTRRSRAAGAAVALTLAGATVALVARRRRA